MAVVAALTVVMAASAGAAPEPRTKWCVRGFAGFATQSLEDWNDEIEAFEDLGIPADFESMGSAFPLGAELLVGIAPQVHVGVAVTHQSASSDNSYADASGSISMEHELSVTSITATAAIALGTAGAFVGGEAGTALGSAETEFHFRDFGDPTNDLDLSGDWDGNNFSSAIFVGWQRATSETVAIFAKLGYRFLDLGELDGTVTSPQLGAASTPPFNFLTGEPKDTDFSGMFVVVGVGFGQFVR